MTILDACVQILGEADGPQTPREILTAINAKGLYKFGAKDPLKVLSGALRNDLKNGSPPRVCEVGKGRYQAS